jgi:ferredoxin
MEGIELVVAERKPIDEIKSMIDRFDRVLVVGCDTCMRVCFAGGEKEVGILSSALRMAFRLDSKEMQIEEITIERQCEDEFIEEIWETAARNDAILSMGCGAGVQTIAELFPTKPVFPALNTTFIGNLENRGIWAEKCTACGDCVITTFGGICPITRCSKGLLNGPCGGSKEGKCEVSDDIDCADFLRARKRKPRRHRGTEKNRVITNFTNGRISRIIRAIC